MEISRYASRLARTSPILPSGRPPRVEANFREDIQSQASELLNRYSELPQESEDAVLTGGTRSLSRRLLALNIPGLSAIQPASHKLGRKNFPGKTKLRKVLPNLIPHNA